MIPVDPVLAGHVRRLLAVPCAPREVVRVLAGLGWDVDEALVEAVIAGTEQAAQ